MTKWPMVKLGDVCLEIDTVNPMQFERNISYIDISSVCSDNKKILNYNLLFSKDAPSRARQKVKYNDILVSTVRPNLNAVAIIDCQSDDLVASTGFCVIRPDCTRVSNRYLFEYVKSKSFIDSMTNQATGASYPAVSNKIVRSEQIPLPPLPIQQKIADVLDRAGELIEKRKSQIAKLDLLVKSQFIEMFGDPVTNPMGWEMKRLGDFGSLKNGMNFNQHDTGYSIKCLGVGDFGNLYKIENTADISEISLSTNPASEYLLRDGDIVFVRSNGNKELVGRSVEVFPRSEKMTFSGFCIRYRNESPELLTVFLNHALHLPSLRVALLRGGRGANIQNVNQQTLSSLAIPLPPLTLQNRFADFVKQADKSKFELQQGLIKLELLYKSLMQKCFNGEL